jgi:hypothetical protein
MIQLTQLQLGEFEVETRAYNEQSCITFLRKEFASVTQQHPDEKLLELIRFGFDRAKAHGITSLPNLKRWLRLMMRLGPAFDIDERQEGVRSLLTDTRFNVDQRLESIEHML